MPLDPIQEIRAIRAERMRQFDGDLDKYADYVAEKFRDSDLNLVPATPKRIKPVKPTKPKASKAAKKPTKTTRRKRSA